MLTLIGLAVDLWMFGKLVAFGMVVVGLYILFKK